MVWQPNHVFKNCCLGTIQLIKTGAELVKFCWTHLNQKTQTYTVAVNFIIVRNLNILHLVFLRGRGWHVHMLTPRCACGSQTTTFRNGYSPSTMRVLGTELRASDLTVSVDPLSHLTGPTAYNSISLKYKLNLHSLVKLVQSICSSWKVTWIKISSLEPDSWSWVKSNRVLVITWAWKPSLPGWTLENLYVPLGPWGRLWEMKKAHTSPSDDAHLVCVTVELAGVRAQCRDDRGDYSSLGATLSTLKI